MEFGVNPHEASTSADQVTGAASEISAVRQEFASIVERAAEASGDLGIKGHCLEYHDTWSRAILDIEQHGIGTGQDIGGVSAHAEQTGEAVADDYRSMHQAVPDATGISRSINGS